MKRMGPLVATMVKIGLIGFGGGNALVPILERECVVTRPLVSQEEYDREVIVANITPGALPVEVASGIGRCTAGAPGMIIAAATMGLPGSLLTFILLALFSIASQSAMEQVRFASVGIAMLIIYVLASYIVGAISNKPARSRERTISILLVVIVFVLTCGEKLAELAGLNTDTFPMLTLSTLDVLGVVFFAIIFCGGHFLDCKRSRIKTCFAFLIALCYLLSANDVGPFPPTTTSMLLIVLMVILGVWGFVMSLVHEHDRTRRFPWRSVLKLIGAWAVFVVVLCLPALLLVPETLALIGSAAASVLMSWGGGDAYLVIGQGLFVDSSMITNSQYFQQIVTVSNAMPGSIVCKVLTGVGYFIGMKTSVEAAVALALAGFACGVGMSGITFCVIYFIYEQFEPLSIFRALRRYIRPVIGGLLLTIALSLFTLNIDVANDFSIAVPAIVLLSATILVLLVWLGRVHRAQLATLIVVSAVIALGVCNALVFV